MALAISALALVLALLGLACLSLREKSAPTANAHLGAMAVFDRLEADAKARGCTVDLHWYRKVRKDFTTASLAASVRGGKG